LPNFHPAEKREEREKALALMRERPDLTYAEVAEASGLGRDTIWKLRKGSDIPRNPRGGKRAKAPSAPLRKHNDPREGSDAKIIQIRPVPPTNRPSDLAVQILRMFDDLRTDFDRAFVRDGIEDRRTRREAQ
jgi:hypothetical protein